MRRPLLIALAVVLCFPVQPLSAQTPGTVGIRLVDAPSARANDSRAQLYIVDHLALAATIHRRVEVRNDTDDALTVELYAAAAEVHDGQFRFGDDRASNELATWTAVDPSSVRLDAGDKALAGVTISVPATASSGERYAVVWAELPAAVPSGGGIAAVNRVGVRIYLSVGPGGEPDTDFVITSIAARRNDDGVPLVTATVENTGGRALDLSGDVRLTDGPAGLSAGPFVAGLGTTLGIGETEPVRVPLDRAIPAGAWNARLVLRSGTTERHAQARITIPAKGGAAVRTEAGGSGIGLLLAICLAAVGVGLLLLVVLRRRSADEEADTTAG